MTRAEPLRLAGLLLATLALAGCAQIRQWMPGAKKATPAPEPAATEPARAAAVGGTLLLSGGGRVSGAVIAEAAALTSTGSARLLVVPLASSARDPGRATAEVWEKAGFAHVEVLDTFDAANALRQVEAADFLWFTGGDQLRLADRLLESDLTDRIRARFRAGALVGGTSAGAAAVAELVLTTPAAEDEIEQGAVGTAPGLALWPGVIVDSAFLAKKRFNRLMSAVLDHPELVGVGIDEGTGVVVSGTTLRVVGDGNVVLLDARRASVTASHRGDAAAATGVATHVLADGMTFDLARR